MTLEFICTAHPEIDNIISYDNREIEPGIDDWRHYAGGIYLDGAVETANHYDCVELINYDGLPTVDQTDSFETTIRRSVIPDGIHECKVYGYENPCKLFLWHYNQSGHLQYRGLIVDTTDPVSLKYATKKYNEKSYSL